MKKKKNTIVVVNSYKGGAGKTSIALSYCVTRAYQNRQKEVQESKTIKEKIFFIDIDLLGTGSEYLLMEKDSPKKDWLNSQDKEKSEKPLQLDDFVNVLRIKSEPDLEFEINAILTNPVMDSYFVGDNGFRKNRAVEESIYRHKVKKILQKIMENESDHYIVLDCSPGVSVMEKEILNIIYNESNQNNKVKIEVHEVYVSTYDNGHFKKTADNLKKDVQSLKISEERNIEVVLNDIHNIALLKQLSDTQEGVEGAFNFELEVKDAVEELRKELNTVQNLKICTVEYNFSMAASCIYKNTENIISHPDKYIFNEKNYHEYKESVDE